MAYRGIDYTLSLCADYQAVNAATVLETVGALRRAGLNLPDEGVKTSLANTQFPARFEVLSIWPAVIVDGAHNRHGIEALCASMKPLRSHVEGKLHLMVGMLRDKSPLDALSALEALFAGDEPFALGRLYLLTPDSPRAMPAEELGALLRSLPCFAGVETVIPPSAAAASRMAVEALEEGDALLCFGSLYLAAEQRRSLVDALDRS
jgi:dihydrofolate synthase/folylpolyglutamate synthase